MLKLKKKDIEEAKEYDKDVAGMKGGEAEEGHEFIWTAGQKPIESDNFCPLIQTECARNRCAWWSKYNNRCGIIK